MFLPRRRDQIDSNLKDVRVAAADRRLTRRAIVVFSLWMPDRGRDARAPSKDGPRKMRSP